jgi:hypothetical protein
MINTQTTTRTMDAAAATAATARVLKCNIGVQYGLSREYGSLHNLHSRVCGGGGLRMIERLMCNDDDDDDDE